MENVRGKKNFSFMESADVEDKQQIEVTFSGFQCTGEFEFLSFKKQTLS